MYPQNFAQRLVRFCQRGEISPNLVSLVEADSQKRLNAPKTFTAEKIISLGLSEPETD